MLKYPTPPPPNGPHTFVDDACYLKDHFDAAGGIHLIFKYTGRSPATTSASTPARSTTSTPPFQKLNSLRQRTLGARSPLSASARILQNPSSVEALLQGAAKNVMERGEKLGINQAVRDAVGEIRRNLQEARISTRGVGDLIGDSISPPLDHALAITVMEKRNRRLAVMLDESVTNLKLLVASGFEGDKAKHLGTVEIATAKMQFVKACLEDPSLSLPEEELPAITSLTISSPTEARSPTVALDTTPVVMTSSAVEETRSALSSPESGKENTAPVPLPSTSQPTQPALPDEHADKMDTDPSEHDTVPPLLSDVRNQVSPLSSTPTTAATTIKTPSPASPPPQQQRPSAPIPTRSTLAQSSFAWMLEPDTTTSSLARAAAAAAGTSSSSTSSTISPFASSTLRPSSSGGGSGSNAQRRRPTNPSRERNAFLFGEVTPPLSLSAAGGGDGGDGAGCGAGGDGGGWGRAAGEGVDGSDFWVEGYGWGGEEEGEMRW